MSRIAYVNGRYVPHHDAMVHVEDRGYQFADGVYEVCEVRHRHLLDMTPHLERLQRSLSELRIEMPVAPHVLPLILDETVRRNRVVDGLVYIQISRGVWRRDHPFPPPFVRPALVVTARSSDREAADAMARNGVSVITVPENRWPRVDIKSVSLLPNVLAKQEAKEAGSTEAWFIDADGLVTEGSSTNAWIITKEGVLVTRPAESGILRGITRTRVLALCDEFDLKFEERAFAPEEALEAKESFITAATSVVMPVVEVDGQPIANGHPGEIALKLRDNFFELAEKRRAW
ncbi:MAG: D-amino-acid transaminase [Pseudomonadota bacterium]